MYAFLKNFLQSMFTAIFIIPLNACAYSDGPVEGAVLEEGIHKPIPGAIVVIRWVGTAFSFAHTQSVCIHVESAITDDKGHFHIPAWRASVEPAGVHDLKPLVTVHKPGYEEYRAPGYVRTEAFKQNIRYLKPFTGGREERLKYLERVEQSIRTCRSPEAEEKNLLPLYRAFYEEAKTLAKTKEDQKIADGFLAGIEIIELGYKEGMRRALERAEKRDRQL